MSDWPKSGDSLFAGGDWEAEALAGGSSDWVLAYATAYKEAADAVVEAVQAKNVPPDAVSYAVVFLYRHYVELMLKGLIILGAKLEQINVDYSEDGHKIDLLWTRCRAFLERTFPDGEKADTDAVEERIKELISKDPSGEAFRYGEDKRGKPYLPEAVQFNLTNMRGVINGMAGLLEGSYDGMSELLQCQADIDSGYSE